MSTLNSNPASTNSISSIDAEKQKVYDEFQFISKINEIVINDTLVIKLKPTDNYDWARGIKYSTGGYFSQRLLLDLPPDKWTTIDKKYNTYHIRQSEYWDWKTFKSRELTDLLKSKTPFKVTINGLDLSISSCFKIPGRNLSYRYEFDDGFILFTFDGSKMDRKENKIALQYVYISERLYGGKRHKLENELESKKNKKAKTK